MRGTGQEWVVRGTCQRCNDGKNFYINCLWSTEVSERLNLFGKNKKRGTEGHRRSAPKYGTSPISRPSDSDPLLVLGRPGTGPDLDPGSPSSPLIRRTGVSPTLRGTTPVSPPCPDLGLVVLTIGSDSCPKRNDEVRKKVSCLLPLSRGRKETEVTVGEVRQGSGSLLETF